MSEDLQARKDAEEDVVLARVIGTGGPLIRSGDSWFFRNSETNHLLPIDDDPVTCRLLERYMLDVIADHPRDAGLLIKTVRAYTVGGALDYLTEEVQKRIHAVAAERVKRIAHVREYFFQNFGSPDAVLAEYNRRDKDRGHGFRIHIPCRGTARVWANTGKERRRLVVMVQKGFDAHLGRVALAIQRVEEIGWDGDPLVHLIATQDIDYPKERP